MLATCRVVERTETKPRPPLELVNKATSKEYNGVEYGRIKRKVTDLPSNLKEKMVMNVSNQRWRHVVMVGMLRVLEQW